MPRPVSDLIHPSAIISPEAQLAEDVRVGPFVVIEGAVSIGAGSVIRPHATSSVRSPLVRTTTSARAVSSEVLRNTSRTRASRRRS